MSTFLNPNAIVDGSITPEKMMEGEYLNMTTGFSHELTGRIEATPEEFTFRPSAGEKSIRDENATIKSIKGNSLVWNNKIKNGNFADNPASDALPSGWENGSYYITLRATISYPSTGGINFLFDKGNSTTNNITMNIIGFDGIIKGHKYLLSCDYSVNGVSETSYPNAWFALGGTISENVRKYLPNTNGVKTHLEIMHQPTASSDNFAIQMVRGYVEGAEFWINNIIYIDLTQMFGDGNEPTTIEEFYARIPEGIDINAYNPGEIISMNANAIETNGLNQWDEEWVAGMYQDDIDGKLVFNSGVTSISSKNLIEVFPETTYYLYALSDMTRIFYLDSHKKCFEVTNMFGPGAFTTRANAKYIMFSTSTSYGNTYKNDICINLSHTGVRNGEYEPYWKSVKDLSVIKKYFPNGMRSVGSVYDEIKYDEAKQKWVAIQRIESVDLGSLDWEYISPYGTPTMAFAAIVNANFNNKANEKANILSDTFIVSTVASQASASKDYTIAAFEAAPSRFFILDSRYTDTTTFKDFVNGKILYYELAEPIVTEIDDIVDFSYKVGDFGIEKILTDTSSTTFRGDIVYGFNAVDTIRNNYQHISQINEKMITSITTNGVDKLPVNGNVDLANIAYDDEYYADMAVGTADNLRGRDEAIEREFTFDVSAGEKNSIKEEGTATIKKIKGNTMCWNQLVYNGDFKINGGNNTLPDGWTMVGGWEDYLHISYDEDGMNIEVLTSPTSAMAFGHMFKGGMPPLSDNLFLCNYTINEVDNQYITFINEGSIYTLEPGSHQTLSLNGTVFGSSVAFNIASLTPVGTKIKIHYVRLTNLILLYQTKRNRIEAFKKDFPNDYYDYCEPTFFNNKTEKIVTTGFNQWDEEWVVGSYGLIGDKFESNGMAGCISSKNLIEVFPETTYYLHIPNAEEARIFFLDSHENRLGVTNMSSPGGRFTTSADTKYIMFSTTSDYGGTYNNDICINISHSAVANGVYHPYMEFEHEVPVNKYFPDGMRCAINAYDEINEKEAIQRICSFKVSDCFDNMVFEPSGYLVHFTAPYALALPNSGDASPNVICNKVTTYYQNFILACSSAITLDNATGEIVIRDTSISTFEAFKEKYGDVTIYAELAEPIVTPLKARAINFNYPVWDWGTERAVSAEPDAIANVPFRADIIYGFNAVDTIRNNKRLLNTQDQAITTATRKLNIINSMICTEPYMASQYLICSSLPVNQCIYMNFNGQGFRKWRKVATTSDNMVVMECEHKYDDTQWLYRAQFNRDSYYYYSFNMPSNTVRWVNNSSTSVMALSGITYINHSGRNTLAILLGTLQEPIVNENTNYEVHLINTTPSPLILNVRYCSNAFGERVIAQNISIPSNREAVIKCYIPFHNRTNYVAMGSLINPNNPTQFMMPLTITCWDENGEYTKLY